jgi:hypothetical protein
MAPRHGLRTINFGNVVVVFYLPIVMLVISSLAMELGRRAVKKE